MASVGQIDHPLLGHSRNVFEVCCVVVQVFLALSGGKTVQFVVKGIRSVEAVGSQVTIFISELKAFDQVRRVFNLVCVLIV
jgi:hypothetical protein